MSATTETKQNVRGRNRDPETLDIIDNLNRSSGQLEALLVSITGPGADHFHLLSRVTQDYLLDCATDLAERIGEASGQL